MTSCNTTPTSSLSPAQRLKAARIALPAKQDEIATFWQLANRQVISDWERGKNEIPAEMLPKIEQLEGWAAAGGGLDAARAELARLKDRELAAQFDRVHTKATTWQALGSRPVPLIQSAQLELGAPPTPSATPVATPPALPTPRLEVASQPPADPYKVTIDWEGFVVEVEGKRGVSLRELVKAGLFEQMPHAVRALKSSGAGFTPVREDSRGGRPAEDYLMGLRDAQRFCARVRTEVGGQILDLILDHHDEMQRLIAGDHDAQQRLADAQAVHERIEAQASVDPLLGSLLALAQVRTVQLDQAARIEALEARERIRQEESERMLARLKGAGLPAPTVDAPALTTRKAIVAQMARVGMDAGNRHEQHQAAWRHLYSQYEHRAGVDLRTRAKNAQQTILDYAETHGHLDALYALSCELWPNGAGDVRA